MAPTQAFQLLTLVIFCITNGQGIGARDLKIQDPYTTTYNGHKTHTKESGGTYNAAYNGYTKRSHDSNGPYNAAYNGYTTHAHDSNGPYNAAYNGYTTRTHDSDGPYSAAYNGYKTHTHDSNGPYNVAYNGYTTRNHDFNGPYTPTYNEHKSHSQNSNGPYNAAYNGYTTHTHDSKGPYTPSYNGYKTHTQDSNGPYNAAYNGYTTHTDDSNGPYNAAYNGYTTHNHDSNGPYNAAYNGYTTHVRNFNGPYTPSYNGYKTNTHDGNGPYNAAYNGYTTHTHDSKGVSSLNAEESKDPKGPPSPNLDHTEAHKTGFFNLHDIYVGNVMTLQFSIQEVSPYLSKKEADSIPFSMSQLPSVLQLFSIPEDSPQVKSMRHTLQLCEDKAITGETKICANSLESMLEFVDRVIGSDVKHNILTTNNPSPSATPLQNYTILEVSHDINAPKWVSCHPLPYPYAIYYCHYIATGTKVFKVSLVGDKNEDKMEALGICHLDTSEWSPDLILFKQLGIKAGKNSPVCHFFPVRNILWVAQPSDVTAM